MMIDSHGRKINYLRLCVTDRCNLRCRYCIPEDGIPLLQHGETLTYEELFLVARTAVSLGIEKIRVTASGLTRGCLFSEAGTDLKPILRGKDPSVLENSLLRIVGAKRGRHRLREAPSGPSTLDMSRVGG